MAKAKYATNGSARPKKAVIDSGHRENAPGYVVLDKNFFVHQAKDGIRTFVAPVVGVAQAVKKSASHAFTGTHVIRSAGPGSLSQHSAKAPRGLARHQKP